MRSASLREIQKVLNSARGTKITAAGYTRWLTHESAVNSVGVNFIAILLDLENAIVNGDSTTYVGSGPTAEGLLKTVKTFHFFQQINLLCDVLAVVSRLTFIFESNTIDLSIVESKISHTVQNLKRKPGGGATLPKS